MKKILGVLLTIVLFLSCCAASAETITILDQEVATGLQFPLEEPVTLTIMVKRDTTDTSDFLNSQPQYKELEALTNIHIEWICVPSSGWNERKNLIFASGDYPDAMIDEEITDLDISANAEVLLKINEYLAYMPNMSKAFESFPELRAITTSPDGNMYSLGQRRPLVDTPQMLCINKTWLNALNLQIPTTLDELYDVLTAFKNGDPNGNGDPTDEVPLTFTIGGTTTGWAPLFGSFGIIDYSSPQDAYVRACEC